jgi:hypothetical protein
MLDTGYHQDHTCFARESTQSYKKGDNMRTVLFTLKNPHELDPMRIRWKSGGSNALGCRDSLYFGAGHDSDVCDHCNMSENSHSNIGNSFENRTGMGLRRLFDGVNHCTVEERTLFHNTMVVQDQK